MGGGGGVGGGGVGRAAAAATAATTATVAAAHPAGLNRLSPKGASPREAGGRYRRDARCEMGERERAESGTHRCRGYPSKDKSCGNGGQLESQRYLRGECQYHFSAGSATKHAAEKEGQVDVDGELEAAVGQCRDARVTKAHHSPHRPSGGHGGVGVPRSTAERPSWARHDRGTWSSAPRPTLCLPP